MVKVIDVTARKSRAGRRRNVSDPLFASNEGLTTSDKSCPKKCEEQDAAKIFNLKCLEHDFKAR